MENTLKYINKPPDHHHVKNLCITEVLEKKKKKKLN